MSADPRPRPDLSALRIEREPEKEQSSLPIGRIAGWIFFLIALIAAGVFVYNQWILPGRAPVVETLVVKPTVNVSNPPLLAATGYLVADRQSKITPKISGKVVKLNFDVGAKVKKGDVLAVLESTTLQAQLDEANASLDQSKREFDRQAALWKQGVTSRSLLDNAEAQLKAARARVDQVRINMQDMTVRAPFDGTIATKNTEVGEVISSVTLGQVSGTLPAGAICTIVDLNTLEVEADVNQGNIGQVHEGQPAEATVKVKVKILNPGEHLLPEMSATVSFLQAARTQAELHEPPRIWLPTTAVVN